MSLTQEFLQHQVVADLEEAKDTEVDGKEIEFVPEIVTEDNEMYWIKRRFLPEAKKQINMKNDYVTLITGKAGSSKSTLAIKICQLFDPKFSVEKNIVYDAHEFMEKVKSLPEGSAILVDEGVQFAQGKKANSKISVQLEEFSTTMRKHNKFIVICVTEYFLLNGYWRTGRLNYCFHNKYRGYTSGFNDSQIHMIKKNPNGIDAIYPSKPQLEDRFNKIPEESDVWKAYMKAKMDKTEKHKKTAYQIKMEKFYQTRLVQSMALDDIAYSWGKSRGIINQWRYKFGKKIFKKEFEGSSGELRVPLKEIEVTRKKLLKWRLLKP